MATEQARRTIKGFFVISLIVVAVLAVILYFRVNASLPLENVLYYGEECPHCKNVEAFIENNSVNERMNITQKEVWYNQTNKAEFAEVIKYCSINPSNAGVPLFYTGEEENKTCLSGDKDIINFLKVKLNISESQ